MGTSWLVCLVELGSLMPYLKHPLALSGDAEGTPWSTTMLDMPQSLALESLI
jgi:hypothetical protein